MDWQALLNSTFMRDLVLPTLFSLALAYAAGLIRTRWGIDISKDQQAQVTNLFRTAVLKSEEKGEALKEKKIPVTGEMKNTWAVEYAQDGAKALKFIKKVPECKWFRDGVDEAVAKEPTIGATAQIKISSEIPKPEEIPGQVMG